MNRFFRQTTKVDAPLTEVFAWHERPGAFERLSPPWEDLKIIRRTNGLKDGEQLEFAVRFGPIWQGWVAEHFGYVANQQFCDRQISGPFAKWEHTHRFREENGTTMIDDEVAYQLPAAPFSDLAPRCLVENKVDAMFRYRRRVAKQDIERHHRAGLDPKRVAITGASGMVGTALSAFLTTGGHRVTPLVRGAGGTDSVAWNPERGMDDTQLAALEGTDAVVHLAGESILGVWTEEKRRRIRESRVVGTRKLAESLARMKQKPAVMVCASAIGYYGGACGDQELVESSPSGNDFLAEVGREWEAASKPAEEAGIRVVRLRIGVVLSPRGGALRTMLLPFSMGLGGRLGDGRQWTSWVSLDDLVYLIHHAIATPSLAGAVNATTPTAVTNGEFTSTLARVLGRFVGPPAPAFLLRAAPGDMAEQVFLASQKVFPQAALQSGFKFAYPTLETALRHMLGRALD